MENKYAKVESFIAVLMELNPKGQFKIENENSIVVKYRDPHYLNLPSGYLYDAQRKSITNGRGNDFHIIQQKAGRSY